MVRKERSSTGKDVPCHGDIQEADFQRLVKASPVFAGVEEAFVLTMLADMECESWPKGYLLESAVNLHGRFSILISGRIKVGRSSVEDGREVTLFLLGPGDGFSVMNLFGLLKVNDFGLQGRTLDKVELLWAPLDRWLSWMAENESLRQSLTAIASSHLERLCDLASGLALDSVMTRFVHLLLRHVDWSTHSLDPIRHLSQEELANMIGTVRPVLGRLLSELRRDGVMDLREGELHIIDLQSLIDRADQSLSYSQIWCTADSAVPCDRSIFTRSPSLNFTPWTTSASSL